MERTSSHPPLPMKNLLQELDTLCSKEQGDPLEYERKLAAWVLLVRLDTNALEQVWNQHGSILQQFAMDILLVESQEETQDSGSDVILLSRYLRILAQVTTRVSPYPIDMAQRLLQLWIQLPVQDLSIPVHVDIISTLEVFLFTHPDRANSLSLLNVIWKQYQRIISVTASDDTNNNNDKEGYNNQENNKEQANSETNSEHERSDEDAGTNMDDVKIMAETLDGILDGCTNAKQGDYSFTKYSLRSLHELILGIFSQEGVEELIPVTMVSSLVEFITTTPPPSLDQALRISWHEWFLTWIASRCTPSARPFHQVLLDNPKFHRMLLSHVISPAMGSTNRDDSTLRAMAWQTLVTLVEINDWNWMILSSHHATTPTTSSSSSSLNDPAMVTPNVFPSTSVLGRASLLCTWIRLASGELRIQLQSLLIHHDDNITFNNYNTNNTKEQQGHHQHHQQPQSSLHGGWQATALPVGHGCARLLQSVVRYLIRLADQPHIPMPIEGEALLHLRQSLEQALWTAVEYLSIASAASASAAETNLLGPNSSSLSTISSKVPSPPPSAPSSPSSSPASLHNHDRASLFHAILRLLGTLLMEVDIFDLLYQSPSHQVLANDDIIADHVDHDDNDCNASPIVILTCLMDVLPIAEDPSLLPGLVHIMGDAEDDPLKQQLLRTYLAHPLLEYLDWYWQREPAVTLLDDSVAWACTCTELWAQLLSVMDPLAQQQQQPPDHSSSSTVSLQSSNNNLQQQQEQQQQRRRLCLTLLTWIQDLLFLLQGTGATSPRISTRRGTSTSTTTTTKQTPTDNHYPSSLNYLSLALGCYMTLSKDRSEPPTEHETRLVLRALQRCERS